MSRPPRRETANVSRAMVRVGDGRGFIVAHRQARFVITAAHCLPVDDEGCLRSPPALPAVHLHEKTYPKPLGALDAEPSVWCECRFVNPVADIAVLGGPDGQELYEKARVYDTLVDSVKPLVIADAPQGEATAYLMSLDGERRKCTVTRRHQLNCPKTTATWLFLEGQARQSYRRTERPSAWCQPLAGLPLASAWCPLASSMQSCGTVCTAWFSRFILSSAVPDLGAKFDAIEDEREAMSLARMFLSARENAQRCAVGLRALRARKVHPPKRKRYSVTAEVSLSLLVWRCRVRSDTALVQGVGYGVQAARSGFLHFSEPAAQICGELMAARLLPAAVPRAAASDSRGFPLHTALNRR